MTKIFSFLPTAMNHTLLYGLSIAVMKGVSLLMLPVIANYLSAEQFGLLEVISSIAIFGCILVAFSVAFLTHFDHVLAASLAVFTTDSEHILKVF